MQDGLTGSAWGDWATYTDSPLRAFENELGVQAPVGFWDPAGLSADGSVENFKRRRATEIKHGRIAMLATMGYITPEITGKFPGYLSPSAGLKFADIPNGLAAISKVPQAGWGQILLYMAYCEVSQTQEPGTAAYAGDFGFKVLTSSDPAEKTKKLNAEIANGRLAMMAIIGMFFQDVCYVVHVAHVTQPGSLRQVRKYVCKHAVVVVHDMQPMLKVQCSSEVNAS